MADELYFCVTCKRTMDESNFYSSYDLERYPSGKLDECKKCCTMGIDNFDPETYKPLLEKIDIPYVPEAWMDLLQKYAKNKKSYDRNDCLRTLYQCNALKTMARFQI